MLIHFCFTNIKCSFFSLLSTETYPKLSWTHPLCISETPSLRLVCGIFAFLSTCLISFTPPCYGGNILVFPIDGSHWVNMKILLEELHARGHNLTVIRDSSSWYISEKSPLYTTITIKMSQSFEKMFEVFVEEQIRVRHVSLCIEFLGHLVIHISRQSPNNNFLMFFLRHKEMELQHLLS